MCALQASGEIESLAAEHIDRLYYLSDIFQTGGPDLSAVLCEQLLHKLMLPLVMTGMVPGIGEGTLSPMFAMIVLAQVCAPACCEALLSKRVSLYKRFSTRRADATPALAQVFYIFRWAPLVDTLVSRGSQLQSLWITPTAAVS